MEQRGWGFEQDILFRHRRDCVEAPVVAFTHEQFIRAFIRRTEGLSVEQHESLRKPGILPNCSLTLFERVDDELRCLTYGFVPPEVEEIV